MFLRLGLISLASMVLTAAAFVLTARYTDWLEVEISDDFQSSLISFCEHVQSDRPEISELVRKTYCRCYMDYFRDEFMLDELILIFLNTTPQRYQGQEEERLAYHERTGNEAIETCLAIADNVEAEEKSERQ